jgi:hypothetical protein
MVIRLCLQGVTKAGDINRRLSVRVDYWDKNKYDILVQDTECTALAQLAQSRGGATLPLIRSLKEEIPDVNQPWCADNLEGGRSAGIRYYFEKFQEKGPEGAVSHSLPKTSLLSRNTTRLQLRLPSNILALLSLWGPDTFESS